MNDFILASSSPTRIEMLKFHDIDPKDILSPDVDESNFKSETPKIYSIRMAKIKAGKVFDGTNNVLAFDTVACLGRRIIHKCETNDEVRAAMQLLSGRNHRVYTSICLIRKNGKKTIKTIETRIKWKKMTQREIEFYVQTGEGVGKAGGYSIAGIAERFILRIVGSYSSVRGLPTYETLNLIASLSGDIKI